MNPVPSAPRGRAILTQSSLRVPAAAHSHPSAFSSLPSSDTPGFFFLVIFVFGFFWFLVLVFSFGCSHRSILSSFAALRIVSSTLGTRNLLRNSGTLRAVASSPGNKK